jgi:DNA-binding IclR family transcriptional regulator
MLGHVSAPPVPAISRAVRLVSVLLETPDGATLSTLAARAAVSKSTAFNLVRTMTAEGLLTFDGSTRRYNLGPRLIEFGAVAVGRTPTLLRARTEMERVAQRTGLACLAIQRAPEGHFLAVDKIESRKDIKVTIEVGERFPHDSPLLSRIWHAWGNGDGDAVDARGRYTDATVVDPEQVEAAEQRVREQGFGAVYGEYIENLNVVGIPVFDRDARPTLIVAVLGIGSELGPEHVRSLAPTLVAAGREVTLESGGRLPATYPRTPVDTADDGGVRSSS